MLAFFRSKSRKSIPRRSETCRKKLNYADVLVYIQDQKSLRKICLMQSSNMRKETELCWCLCLDLREKMFVSCITEPCRKETNYIDVLFMIQEQKIFDIIWSHAEQEHAERKQVMLTILFRSKNRNCLRKSCVMQKENNTILRFVWIPAKKFIEKILSHAKAK